ncbi:hypothetical protein Pan97_26240 [Bremerella volcania]|uniref:Uncharacterized protein n=1 Tax=Bremerella volcania TaxID=2527984 RepID=A0A518C8Q5_9BACT|nr:hypothetical protein [Bremerella volcania]QDU75590.1 hypothetical protein Pan97_26240 [Bremerella volcania]
MSADMTKAQKYLLPPSRSFWKWSDDGEVICWHDDRTIIFKVELIQVLQRLAPMGLPSLSSLVVTLASMREGWAESISEVMGSVEVYDPSAESSQLIESVLLGVGGLGKLAALPQSLRSSTEVRVTICQMVFENVRSVLSAEEAPGVIQYLTHGMDEVLATYNSPGFQVIPFRALSLADLVQLNRGLEGVDEKSIELRKRTSLDELPQAAEIELPQSQQMRGLLDKLQHDESLQGVARLAKQLMGAVSLPRKVSDPDEVPTGGISDISNRGSLDQLMLTELAHDDLTLAVRISSNEALYLRRESPPQATWREFSLFLDCGIRMWGVPRFYATAVALALVANAEEYTVVRAFRADGVHLKEVDLLTRDGIVEHLQCLQAELHPGGGLKALAAKLNPEEESNPVLITTHDVAHDKSFQEALAAQAFPLLYLATVNRDGSMRLEQRGLQGRKLLRELELNLEDLYGSKPKKLPALVEKTWGSDLPAIFSIRPFPLLLSVNITSDQQMHLGEHGVLGITKDRRLMHWHRKEHIGARQLADDLPPGRLQWFHFDEPSDLVNAIVVETNSRKQSLLAVQLGGQTTLAVDLQTSSEFIPLAWNGGMLLGQKGANHLCAIDTTSGEEVQSTGIPSSWKRCSGRFYRNPRSDEWCAVSFDGKTIRMEKVFSSPHEKTPWLMHIFECKEVEGPIGLTHKGDICFTATGELWETQIPKQSVKGISLIGQHASRLCLTSSGLGNYLVDVHKRTVVSAKGKNTSSLLFGESMAFISPSNTRHRFTHIQVCENESGQLRLGLITRRGQRMMIDCSHGIIHLRFPRESMTTETQLHRPFSPLKIPEVGYQVSRAVWNDGSEAFLDSRGLLHLRSADHTIPEVTIALTDGVVAGWVSDGRLWGVHYFTQQQPHRDVDAEIFEQAILGFLEQLV